MAFRVPRYFDFLIDGFHRGLVGRFVHLGHWDEVSKPDPGATAAPDEFECAQRRLNQILLDRADLHQGKRVLDVGCGFGGTLEDIYRRFQGMSLVGINIDPRQLEICRQLDAGSNTLQWVQADSSHLPFPHESFDRILCIEAMFHFASRRAFFCEAARLLRPGGVLVLSDMVVAESAKHLVAPRFCIEAPLQDAYGPWPDFWGEDANHRDLGSAAHLNCSWLYDATVNTRPSHRFTVPDCADERHDPGDTAIRAAMMLRWLHNEGHLRYLYMRFDKPGSADWR